MSHQTASAPQVPQWIDTQSAARLLGVSARSIQRRCQAGTMPGRRTQGARGPVWQVEAQAVEAERLKRDSDDDKGDTTTATRATATRATATTTRGQRVAVILPFPRSKSATEDDDSDGDTATQEGDTRQSVALSVALEAASLKAELAASRDETARERELSAFLKTQIEESNRNAAELRAALRKALEIAPRQLTQGNAPQPQEGPQSATTTKDSPPTKRAPQTPPTAQDWSSIYGQIADELEARERSR